MPRPRRNVQRELEQAQGTLRTWLRGLRTGSTLEHMPLTKAERAEIKKRTGHRPVQTEDELDEERDEPPARFMYREPRRTRRSISTRVGFVG